MKRTDVLNHLIKTYGFTSYLEIGVQNVDSNFKHVKAKVKKGVDPNLEAQDVVKKTSDQFFNSNTDKFDLIFIDGMHTAAQSMKDYRNAVGALNPGGLIAFHDTLPHNEEYTSPDWCGDVWRTAVALSNEVLVITIDDDHGVSVVFPEIGGSGSASFGKYPGVEKLKDVLNATKDLSMLEVGPGDLEEAPEEEEEEPRMSDEHEAIETLSGMTDDELKEEHKKAFGTKPKGKYDRERVIAKLMEA